MSGASELCTRCGLCCDGSLFTQAPLLGEEVARARGRGLTVIDRGGRSALRQRCDALVDRTCGIYEERPAGCRRYVCMLYSALAAGEVGFEEAVEIVGRARALVDGLPDSAQRMRASGAVDPALAGALRVLGRYFDRGAGG
jgi:uncharacterized protein